MRTFDGATLQQADLWHSWGGGAGIRCNGKFTAIDIDSMAEEWAGKIRETSLRL